MQLKDIHDNAVTGASGRALALYASALQQFQCYIGDPVSTADEAIADSPAFAMAHVLSAYLQLLGTEPLARPAAQEAHRLAVQLPLNDRERRHCAAIDQLINGRWADAGRTLEDIAIDYPRDALALQAGHVIDFFRGDARMLRDRIARAMPHWSHKMPGYHAIVGMYAFGLEETGFYRDAEALGRRAVELEPRDGWAQHAVAHVIEMQGRQRDGIAWMRTDTAAWSKDSFFARHNWWHLALFHLELDEIDAVLALYDGPIFGTPSPIVLDLIDASALLWRLQLRGINVGDRWAAIAERWAPIAAAGNYAFNDMHAMMAFASTGRAELAQAIAAAQAAALGRDGDNAAFTREIGQAATRAMKAFGEGDYAAVVRLLRPIRNIAARFGGSHAQRDLLDLTLIEAAFRSGEGNLARALAAERRAIRPNSPLAQRLVERAIPLAHAA